MEPEIIEEKISKEKLADITKKNFGRMVKADIDIKREIIALGGEWHSEGEDLLVKNGSSSLDVWGINFYPWNESKERIEYNSLINIKPSLNNKKMAISNEETKLEIRKIVEKLLLNESEKIDIDYV